MKEKIRFYDDNEDKETSINEKTRWRKSLNQNLVLNNCIRW